MTISPKFLLKLLAAVFVVGLVNTSQLDAMKRKGGPLYPLAKRQCLNPSNINLTPEKILQQIHDLLAQNFSPQEIVELLKTWLPQGSLSIWNIQNNYNQTVLHLACCGISDEIVWIIMKTAGATRCLRGQLMQLEDLNGMSALRYAKDNHLNQYLFTALTDFLHN